MYNIYKVWGKNQYKLVISNKQYILQLMRNFNCMHLKVNPFKYQRVQLHACSSHTFQNILPFSILQLCHFFFTMIKTLIDII